MTVLDLGGWPHTWRIAPVKPAHVTMINLEFAPCDEPWLELRLGDACDPPVAGHFDLVFSNSLIEHVGGHWRRAKLAEAIHQLSDCHWVQTPYRYFPIEPHWLAPGMQFLPVNLRTRLARHWPLGHMGREESVLDVELLSMTEMCHYFPRSQIWRECFGGLTKSLVAIR